MKIIAQSQDLSKMIAVFIAGALHSQAGIKLTKEHIEATKDAIKVEIEKKVLISKVKAKKRKSKRKSKTKTKKKRLIRRPKFRTITTTRPFIYIVKYVGHPMTGMEILFYLIISGLFYFRDDFSQGDQRGVFGNIVDMLVQAKAMQMSGGALAIQKPPPEAAPPPPPPKDVEEATDKGVKIVEDPFK